MGLEILSAGLNYKASKKAAKAQEEAAGQSHFILWRVVAVQRPQTELFMLSHWRLASATLALK